MHNKSAKKIKKLRTYERITSNIGNILGTISKNEEMNFDWGDLHQDGDMALSMTLIGQEVIGWNCFCQGFVHVEWAKIQAKYYRRLGKKSKTLNIGRWKKMLCLCDPNMDLIKILQ